MCSQPIQNEIGQNLYHLLGGTIAAINDGDEEFEVALAKKMNSLLDIERKELLNEIDFILDGVKIPVDEISKLTNLSFDEPRVEVVKEFLKEIREIIVISFDT